MIDSAKVALLVATVSLPFIHAQTGKSDPGMQLLQPSPAIQRALDEQAAAADPQSIHAVELSPDGSRIAWVTDAGNANELHVSPSHHVKASDPIVSAGANCSSSSPRWSPDGKTLAFIGTCADGQPQIYLHSGNSLHQLTHVHGAVTDPAWQPNGGSIAFLYVENATRSAGALAAMKPPAGVIGEEGLEIQWVAAADTQTGNLSILTPKTLHAYEFDWAPDSNSLVFTAAPPPGENTWWIAQVYTARTGHPESAKSILNPATTGGPLHGLQIAVPRFSTNGQNIAFIGGLMSDQGSTGGDIYLMGADGSGLQDLTPGRKSTPAYLIWTDPDHLLFSEYAGGRSHLGLLGTNGKELIAGWISEQSIASGRAAMSFSLSPEAHRVAFASSGPARPPEIYAGGVTGIGAVSVLNEKISAPPSPTVSLQWEDDEFHVQGWLTLPVNYDPAKKYPMIVEVHGGPSALVPPGFSSGNLSFMTRMGYFIFRPNPRGSFGEGEAFTQANRKDFGYGDLRDILKGVDAVEAKYSVDDHRLGLTGWSYGGFMTMFGVTQTDRFRAAAAGAGISDWLSYYGENSIDQWMVPFFGASVYDDPRVYAKSSAIEFIKQVKTPTLVIVGDRDGECPAPQSYEFWHALREQKVPTQLVVYPGEGHRFSNPAHAQDVRVRIASWFGRYLQ